MRARLVEMEGKPLPGRPRCRVGVALDDIREVDPEVAEVLEVALTGTGITEGNLSVLFGELGFPISAGTIGHHRRGIKGHGGRNACRCKKA